jgi:hypothetical protein
MALPAAEIVHGTAVSNTMVDEPNLLVTSLEESATREKRAFKGANAADKIWKYINPILTFSFTAYVSTFAGFADEMPGTAITTLANFNSSTPDERHGFDASEGVIVYEDPTTTQNNEGDLPEMSFTAVHGPFIS